MDKSELKSRTKQFAINTLKLIGNLPSNKINDVIARQIIRSATSIGANYRSACRARSNADFISKIQVVEEETDETHYWLEIIDELKLLPPVEIAPLLVEVNELTAIFTAAGKTAKSRSCPPKA